MISISEQDCYDLQDEIDPIVQIDPLDRFDVTWHYPNAIAQGYQRWIELREGMTLEIAEMHLKNRLLVYRPEMPFDRVQFHFHLCGQHEDGQTHFYS